MLLGKEVAFQIWLRYLWHTWTVSGEWVLLLEYYLKCFIPFYIELKTKTL